MLGGSYKIIDIRECHKEIISKYLTGWKSRQHDDGEMFTTGQGCTEARAILVLNKESGNPHDNYIEFTGANVKTNGEGLLRKINNKN